MAIQQLDLFGNIISTPPQKQKVVVVETQVVETKIENDAIPTIVDTNIEEPAIEITETLVLVETNLEIKTSTAEPYLFIHFSPLTLSSL